MNNTYQQHFKNTLADLKEQGLYNSNIRSLGSPQGAWLQIEGKKVLNMCSNNYLGLANDERIRDAAKEAIDSYGVGPGAVRSIAGTMDLHGQLEALIAKFKNAEAVITLQSGFQANTTVIPLLAGKNDTIISDELNHASIIDGVRLSGCKNKKIYKHSDMADLERCLKEERPGRTLIITDGVFSMDGDVANLPGIVELAEKYNAAVMVDDAHGEGVLGKGGRGIVDHFNLHGRVDVEVGTFSKAIGTVGGCVAGSKELIDYIKQRGRPFLFSSATTPPDVAATIKSFEILMESDELVNRLWSNGDYFKQKMQELGFDTGHSHTPITPVMIGAASEASKMSKELFEEGIFATSIGFPTVAKGKARIRVMISAAHTKEDLDFAVDKFALVGRKMGLIK
ncbi:glycine C-acetyltransferase [Clostridium sp. 'deep sea']|uniref:glycine C-acetyltransferase n=1 Tax=Clostridium sp. 'deep sea' TaxID=2779445 RepID=UPI0018966BD9|nr:glycine C-acetyltransferase [Clostridium sp. 'deep sea']QOR35662.1 glycine C-acetyltransferase [Clostridium sp. 'deep sea']